MAGHRRAGDVDSCLERSIQEVWIDFMFAYVSILYGDLSGWRAAMEQNILQGFLGGLLYENRAKRTPLSEGRKRAPALFGACA